MDNKFKLVKMVVDVAFKLLIFNIEFVEILFKLVNNVVDVAFKLFIDDDKLFILFVFSLSCIFIAKTSTGSGVSPPVVYISRLTPVKILFRLRLQKFVPCVILLMFLRVGARDSTTKH